MRQTHRSKRGPKLLPLDDDYAVDYFLRLVEYIRRHKRDIKRKKLMLDNTRKDDKVEQ
jgi:hypothetical protein